MPKCCACLPGEEDSRPARGSPSGSLQPAPVNKIRYFGLGVAGAALWWVAYSLTSPVSRWIAFEVFALGPGTPTGNAVEFFVYDTAKILLLLILMVYVLAWLRAGMRVERVCDYLAGRGRGIGYVLGAGFGAVTPFCSCSSIPLFLGFTTARIPVGITLAFLITSPLVNEIAVVLLWGLLGWKFTVLYVTVGVVAGVVGGMVMDALHAERWLQPFLLDAMHKTPGQAGTRPDARPDARTGARAGDVPGVSLRERHAFAYSETRSIFRRVWLWVIIGVGLGAVLHGFVPQEWFAENLGAGQWWSVPLAVAVGLPLYTNITGIVPVMESLLLKGLPLGTTLAFCMSTVAASLPEMLMLKQVMRWRLLAVFLGILLLMFTLVGWLFNILQTTVF